MVEKNTTKAIVSVTEGPDGRRVTDFQVPGVESYLDFNQYELLPLLQ